MPSSLKKRDEVSDPGLKICREIFFVPELGGVADMKNIGSIFDALWNLFCSNGRGQNGR